jgi:hypothetical protein
MTHTKEGNQLHKEDLFGKFLFDVEHALVMYADDFCTIPAEGIYDNSSLAPFMGVIESCHIYLIGYTPKIILIDAQHVDGKLNVKFDVLGGEYMVSYDLPHEFSLKMDGDQYYLEHTSGKRSWPDATEMQRRLSSESNDINFEVKYVGQAFGKDGSRNAIDRLLKHETLQRIALKGVPEGYRLSLLLLGIQPKNHVFTMFNPFAKKSDIGSSRIESGLDKLFNTTEAERISLYEASLIRYFYPEFNTTFKDSFPSTNLKILRDCYDKDFSSVIAEICIDDLPYRLWSTAVEPAFNHIAQHDLHRDEARRMFFGLFD